MSTSGFYTKIGDIGEKIRSFCRAAGKNVHLVPKSDRYIHLNNRTAGRQVQVLLFQRHAYRVGFSLFELFVVAEYLAKIALCPVA